MNRRLFLSSLTIALADSLPGQQTTKFSSNPFKLGIASGDPLPDGVVLWTRLVDDALTSLPTTEGMKGIGKVITKAAVRVPISVDWRVATDDKMKNVVKKGKAVAASDLAHSVHVEVDGLKPNRDYWYQFNVGNEESPVGRTRTAPAPAEKLDHLNFAFASCQSYEAGYYTAYEHMVRENLDLIVFLGDYIYENGPNPKGIRQHSGPEIFNLTDYRNRYLQYKSDPLLQKAHAYAPWIVTWDDHEVDNDYAGDIHERHDPRDQFLERRANAYQAYYEHMPLRIGSKPKGSAMQLYRRVNFGGLADFYVLDTRQFRNEQPCGRGTKPQCADALDSKRTIMGDAQTKWLLDGLDKSKTKWNVLANQVMFAKVDFKPGPDYGESMDKWGGYETSRKTVMEFIAKRKPSNPVVITGDVHSNWTFDLKEKWFDEKSATLGSEFVGTSISSSGDGRDKLDITDQELAENPHLKFFNAQRGYVKCSVTQKEWRTDYRILPYVTRPGANISTRASFVIEDGKPGVQKA